MMRTFLVFLFSFIGGYLIFLYLSHPQKKKHKVPKVRIGNIELLPNFRIHFRNKTYHFHHWLILSVVTVMSFIAYQGYEHLMLLKAAAMGGIVQGLRYPDRFKFRHPRTGHKKK